MTSQSITVSSYLLLGEKGESFTAYQLSGGGFIATWEEQKSNTSSIVYQRFDDEAQAVGSRVVVADDWDTHVPTVAELDNGNILVAWQEYSSGFREIQNRVFDSSDILIKSGVASQKSNDDYIDVKVLDLGQNKFIIAAEINDDFPGQPSYGRTLREFDYAGEPLANEVEYISLAGTTMRSDPIALSNATVGSLFYSTDNNTLSFISHNLSSGSLATPITVATQVDNGVPAELIGDANELYISYSSGEKNYVAKLNTDGTVAIPPVQVDENAVSVQLVKMDADHLAVVSSMGDLTGTSDVSVLRASDLSVISSLANVDTGGSNANSNIIFGSNEKLHVASYNNGDQKK